MNNRFIILLAAALCLFSLIYASGSGEEQTGQTTVLNIGLMPAVDTAPIFAAQDAGYFAAEGLEVNLQIFTNAQDRQSALQTGSIDGAMTDLVAVAVNVSGGFDLKATSLTDGMFPILANAGAVDKERLSIGLMEVSVSNFLVDQWLSSDYELEKVYINAIPARLEAVRSGQLDMGFFPEPVSSVGEMNGLQELIFTPAGDITPDVLVFTGTAMDEKAEAIRGFYRAYNRAVQDINSQPDLALETLLAHVPNIHPDTRDLINLPVYSPARLPDESYLQEIIDWTEAMVGYSLNIDAADMVDNGFLP